MGDSHDNCTTDALCMTNRQLSNSRVSPAVITVSVNLGKASWEYRNIREFGSFITFTCLLGLVCFIYSSLLCKRDCLESEDVATQQPGNQVGNRH